MHKSLKFFISAFLIGATSVGLAWAGAGLTPVPKLDAVSADDDDSGEGEGHADDDDDGDEGGHGNVATREDFKPSLGQVLVGAAAVSIEPQPDASKGEVWEKEGCGTLNPDDPQIASLTHAGDLRMKWPEKPNCIYSGGYGIGPMFPITTWDQEYGLASRSVAISDGTDTLVLTILDGTSYFGDYSSLCNATNTHCGAFNLARNLGAELGIPDSGFIFASTHSHTAPDFIGGWGAVPEWYMDQVTNAMKDSVRRAVAGMRPGLLEAGEEIARPFNGERRDFYRSAEDPFLSWFRALEVDKKGKTTGGTIATVGAYAAHPVTADESLAKGDADFPAVFERRVEERFGGVGLYFMTGLGNMSPRGNKVHMGNGLADLVPEPGDGARVDGNDVVSKQAKWDQPVTNSALGSLGSAGFFDRPFNAAPSTVTAGKSGERPCRSASPMSVHTGVSAARVGNLYVTAAPGETFSNLSNTVKEFRTGGVVLPLAQANDGLGYIMQQFETDHAGRQALGFVGSPFAEYEDAYSLDMCFGDMVLETTRSLLDQL